MKVLIYDIIISGHHLEYIHHFYNGALSIPDIEFYFFVSPEFKKKKVMYEWPKASNIKILYCTQKQADKCAKSKVWQLGLFDTLLLKKVVKDVEPNYVLFTSITDFIPLICFLLPRKLKVQGIIYSIYSYEKSSMHPLRLALERIRWYIASRSPIVSKVFLLNDSFSCKEWNHFYKTNKFCFLPDPVPNVNKSYIANVRDKLNIPITDRVFLHFGGMSERKGTLNILKAILISQPEDLKDKTFIFAGRIYNDISLNFYKLFEEAKNKAKIRVFDEFVSYDFIYNLCESSNFILIPYQMSNLSSGVLGYASVFRKPVIGPEKGLIGNLIRLYKLGYTIDAFDIRAISLSFNFPLMDINSTYADKNTRDNFLTYFFDFREE